MIQGEPLFELQAGTVSFRLGFIPPVGQDVLAIPLDASGGAGALDGYVKEHLGMPVPAPGPEPSGEGFYTSHGHDRHWVLIPGTAPDSMQHGIANFLQSGVHAKIVESRAPDAPAYWLPLTSDALSALTLSPDDPASLERLGKGFEIAARMLPEDAAVSLDVTLLEQADIERLMQALEAMPDASETAAPETAAPETEAPETEAPKTEAPETKTPETKAPGTKSPETKAPKTKASNSDALETEAPATVAAESEAPETAAFGAETEAESEAVSAPETRPETGSEPQPTISDADFRFDRPVDGLDGDTLDRISIAEAIAQKVISVWKDQQTPPEPKPAGWQPAYPGHPFIVHLAGSWGSGKSSILNFLAEILRAEESVTLPPPASRAWPGAWTDAWADGPRGWVVIRFNAWRQQGSGSAWWALMTAVATEAPRGMGRRGARFRRRDRLWRFMSGWRNWIVGGFLVITLLLFWSAFAGTGAANLADTLKALGGAVTGIIAIVTFAGTFSPRSQRTAEAIRDLEIDPTAALKQRFEEMIREIHNPVAIFIDDLDRCEAGYVVELLQALQTVYADVGVLYVVAADRDWIVSAYDQNYRAFAEAISEPGLPLGYLFVKKIFQLSVNVPLLSTEDQRAFLRSLLPEGRREAPSSETVQEIETAVEAAPNLAALTRLVRDQPNETLRRTAGRRALRKLMTRDSTEQVTHLLVGTLAPPGAEPLLDANPRAITRLVNAYSFRLGYALRAGELDVIDKLPYWSVLDLRFPLASRRLAEAPALATAEAWKSEPEIFTDPDAIAPILEKLGAGDIETLRRFG